MTEYCIFCETELGCTDPTGWEKCKDPLLVGELVCPWCVKEGKNGSM